MKLLTFGCSFTDNDNENREMVNGKYLEPHNTWPVELARLTNTNPICKGMGGVGNYYIANAVYDTVVNSDDTSVIVMWSGIDRIDMAVSKRN